MTSLETRIVKNIWRFDPISLLILLEYLGYSMDEILFCSHFSNCSQSRLVESIEFHHSPGKKAVITLNLGLLAGQSVLPSYLFKQVQDNSIDEQCFTEFFGYFDDRLLRRYLFAIYPEFEEKIYTNAVHILRLDNIITLHWLTQLVFPELQVRVEKANLERITDLGAPILGKSRLGYQAVLGKIKKSPVPGKRITLITDDDHFTKDQPWPHEIERRLQKLMFPVLQDQDLDLEIWLLIRTQSTSLDLKPTSYLGYENLFSDQLQNRNIRIFSGHLSAWQ